jgi:Dyp-type peroxidase family
MADISPGAGKAKNTIDKEYRKAKEKQQKLEKRKQSGIAFPSASLQKYLLIIRLNLAPPSGEPAAETAVRDGLQRLCTLLAQCEDGTKRVDVLNERGKLQRKQIRSFHFSATIGFGIGFFDLLKIPVAKRPKKLRAMPNHESLGDVKRYSLEQTDMIIQLGASEDFVNRWVLENVLHPVAHSGAEVGDIVSAIAGWATIADVHAGFQRLDGRNLQGFNDGVSNPRRLSPLFDKWVWTTKTDEKLELTDGTYMVFQKIIHDLDQWRALDLNTQELWVGRSKGTGLLLGTFPKNVDDQLAQALLSADESVRQPALERWEPIFKEQADPQARLYDHVDGDLNGKPIRDDIPNQCPAWSHIRKANPRQEDGNFPEHLIFRRGYPFMESDTEHKPRSGLLFIGFQKDIANSFEFIKKNWFGNQDFPVPQERRFSDLEIDARRQSGHSSIALEQTGREGLAGPSRNGVNPIGEPSAIEPLGGGYYFCPPIPNRDPSQIGQQFFDIGAEPAILSAGEGSSDLKGVTVTNQATAKETTLGWYLVIARYNREKWNSLSDDEQTNAREAAAKLFPYESAAVIRDLPNDKAKGPIDGLPATDPLKGVRLLHTFHTRAFVELGQILGTAPRLATADVTTIKDKLEREVVEQRLVNELLAAPGTTQKDPGMGWIAVVDHNHYAAFERRLDDEDGSLRRLYDIEVIPLNNDQTTEDIYDFMTPVSWKK